MIIKSKRKNHQVRDRGEYSIVCNLERKQNKRKGINLLHEKETERPNEFEKTELELRPKNTYLKLFLLS
jgi:hypothetical protein